MEIMHVKDKITMYGAMNDLAGRIGSLTVKCD
jgi:hypothetical protein